MFFNLQRYIERDLEPELQHSLHSFPVTALLGPRQCGKSTLARRVVSGFEDAVYLDLFSMLPNWASPWMSAIPP